MQFLLRETQQKIYVLQESFTLVVVRIINMSRINWILERDGSSNWWFGCKRKSVCWRCLLKVKCFVIKITFHNFKTDTEHRKLRMMRVHTSVKRFFSKHMRGDKFQTAYINHMDSSLLETFLRKNMRYWWMHTISHTHHIVHCFWNCWKKMFQTWMIQSSTGKIMCQ